MWRLYPFSEVAQYILKTSFLFSVKYNICLADELLYFGVFLCIFMSLCTCVDPHTDVCA